MSEAHPVDLQRLGDAHSLRERVSEQLRAALIAGRMAPGQVYSVPSLAEGLGVSATPVREALLDLCRDGFVQAVRNKGFRVTALSEHDLDEIYEVRVLLEIPAVRRLAIEADDEDLARLQPLADDTVAAAKSGDPVRHVEADRRFHLTLLGLLGNQRLVEVVGALRTQTRLFGLSQLAAHNELHTSTEEHGRLLRFLRDRNPDGAAALMHAHLRHTRGIWANRSE